MSVRPTSDIMSYLTMESIILALRNATLGERTALRTALGIITPPSERMAAPYTDFFTKTKKAENDAANKRREAYLATLYDTVIPTDSPAQLVQLHNAWKTTVNSLCPAPFAAVKITSAGGRSKNYDFQFDYTATDGTLIHQQKAEFKHGAASIEKQPQFLSLAAKDLHFPVSYTEFYYDRFLLTYCATDSGITVDPPDRETYLKCVHSANYDSHPFFRCLYNREETSTKAKHAVVNDSIRAYLDAYADKCDLTHLAALMTAKQDGKAFLLWDMSEFHVRWLTTADLTPTEFRGVRNGNTIVLGTATHTLKLLLRWKNHKGILYPAWQISLA